MRGILFATLLVAGCTLEANTLDTTPGPQTGGMGGFDSGAESGGGLSGNGTTGGQAGSAGASGSAGLAGAAGNPADAGPDAYDGQSETDSGEDAAPDGGIDADGASDAAVEAEVETGTCSCMSLPGHACYGYTECTDWCTGLPGWSKYTSIGCWKPVYPAPTQPGYPEQGGCHEIPPPTGPKAGKLFMWYNGSFWECPGDYKKPLECNKWSQATNWGWFDCPYTP